MNTIPSDLLLNQLRWRYATKQFDPAKKIPSDTWSALEESLRLSPSSYGLQPWKFVVITDQALKGQLPAISWDQPQARDCSHYVVFAVKKGLDQAWVDRYVARISEERGVPADKLGAFRGMMLGSIEQATKDGTLDSWQTHQIYIALGTFLSAAALLGVDTCPMEGISRPDFDRLLGLGAEGFESVCGAAAGYRLDSDPNAHLAKVRFPAAEVIAHR